MHTLPIEKQAPMLATVFGQGPYVPTVVWRGRSYQVGQAFADMAEALTIAISEVERIRNEMRGEAPFPW